MTLICLISGQLAPNLLSVIKLKPKRVVLVHTIDTASAAIHFKELITKRYDVRHTKMVEVVPFNPGKLYEQAQTSLNELIGDEIILNYTGGTKPISIQFSKVFEEAGALLLYTDTQQECFWRTKVGEVQEEPFDFRFKLPTYFDLKQVSIRSQTDANQIDKLKELTEYLFEEREKGGISDLKPFIDEAVLNRTSSQSVHLWNPSFGNASFLVENYNNDRDRISVKWNGEAFEAKNKEFWLEYFTGGWFEQWVYLKLIEQGHLDDVRCNVTIRPNSESRSNQLKSEIDVAAIYNAVPIFIECKSGRVDQKSITNLKAIRDEYGPHYSQAVIVSFYPVKDKVLLEKISDYGLILIEGPDDLEPRLNRLIENMVVRL